MPWRISIYTNARLLESSRSGAGYQVSGVGPPAGGSVNRLTGDLGPETRNYMVIGIDASRAFVVDPAGPEYYSLNLIKSMAKIDKRNCYILYLRPGQKINFQLPQNFEIKVINMRYLWTQLGLAFETIFSPPDVLFVPAHTLPLLTRIFRPRLPIVVTIHGLEGKFLPQSGKFLAHIYRNWSISWAVRFAAKLIAVSEDTQRDIIKIYRKSSKDIQIIHEGIDIKRFKNGQTISKYKKYGNYILFVGTIQPRKNLVRLVNAFAQIKNKKIKLVIAGKLGWLYGDVLEAPERFGVEGRVVFLGRVEDRDLPGLYKGAKLFVLPSLTEGFGLPILEAQAAGVPVVTSRAGALPEVAGKGALFVNPLSVGNIKEGIEKILEKKEVAAGLVQEGKINAAKFSWSVTAHNTIKLLGDVYRGS